MRITTYRPLTKFSTTFRTPPKILRQLKEIEAFKNMIYDLLAEGYDLIFDDGVGKNIAPLQKKKMIPYEVLNAGQLKRYLNADW